MPYLLIQTNQSLDADGHEALLARASQCVAQALGKPERYVMVALELGRPMLFGGSRDPLAYLELKSIDLPTQRTEELSATLCRVIGEALGIARERIYIEFADAQRHLWGWNGATF